MELAKLPPGKSEGAATIAKKIKAPQNYLGKILQGLAYQGFVVSQKGLGGGFRLNKDPSKITLYDVVDSIESVSRWSDCILGREKCTDAAPCEAHNGYKAVREAYLKYLQQTTIALLIKDS